VTVSFLTLGFGKLWFTFNLRNPQSGFFRNEVTRNAWVWRAIAFCIVLLVAAVYLPGLTYLLRTESPGLGGWILLLGMSLVPLLVVQVMREIQRRRGRLRD
ncbi:MAG: cation transporting ATPase C-terminal domain-containing protein, partial [Myxococcota bacterium]